MRQRIYTNFVELFYSVFSQYFVIFLGVKRSREGNFLLLWLASKSGTGERQWSIEMRINQVETWGKWQNLPIGGSNMQTNWTSPNECNCHWRLPARDAFRNLFAVVALELPSRAVTVRSLSPPVSYIKHYSWPQRGSSAESSTVGQCGRAQDGPGRPKTVAFLVLYLSTNGNPSCAVCQWPEDGGQGLLLLLLAYLSGRRYCLTISIAIKSSIEGLFFRFWGK